MSGTKRDKCWVANEMKHVVNMIAFRDEVYCGPWPQLFCAGAYLEDRRTTERLLPAADRGGRSGAAIVWPYFPTAAP